MFISISNLLAALAAAGLLESVVGRAFPEPQEAGAQSSQVEAFSLNASSSQSLEARAIEPKPKPKPEPEPKPAPRPKPVPEPEEDNPAGEGSSGTGGLIEIKGPNDPDYDDEVSLTEMSTHDGKRFGKDKSKNVPFVGQVMKDLVRKVNANERNAVFFTKADGDWNDKEQWIQGVIHSQLGGKGIYSPKKFEDLGLDKEYGMGHGEPDRARYWRAVYRSSKALAATTESPDTYVVMSRSQGRTIFSPPQDVENKNNQVPQPVVGAIWKWAELPTLMRNTHVQRIWSIDPNPAPGQDAKKLEWDVNAEGAPRRDAYAELTLDGEPITGLKNVGPMRR